MANPEHIEILEQGVEAWNLWRSGHKDVQPDLSGIDLKDAHLTLADLSHADLSSAVLIRAILTGADLGGAVLSRADLSRADFSHANLTRAVLSPAICLSANFREANFTGADLTGSIITSVDFSYSVLFNTDFTGARLSRITFADNDLSEVKGLEAINHFGPSSIGIDTIYKSRGNIPEVFLRGCGLPESFIVQIPALLAAIEPLQFYSCFISYSSKDQDFATRLHADLQSKGVRCWFAPEDLKIGDRFRDRIDESIRLHDKLLLILSENSVASPWVSDEVEAALEREHREGRIVLFPIKIDEAVTESGKAWAATIRRTRHMGDFTRWKDHDSYQKAFERLLRDLKAEEDNKLKRMTADSLTERAVLYPRNTIKEVWDEVEDTVVQAATHYGLAGDERLVDCAELINILHDAGKITDKARGKFFTLRKVHFNITFSPLLPVEPGMVIGFVKEAKELQKALTVDTPPLR